MRLLPENAHAEVSTLNKQVICAGDALAHNFCSVLIIPQREQNRQHLYTTRSHILVQQVC